MAFGGFMNSREPPVHLPTGTPRSSSTILRVHQLLLLPGDPILSTTHGTTTLQDPHSHRHRRPWVREPILLQRPEPINGSTDTAVWDDTNDTPQGSTTLNAYSYTAVRVLSTDTPPDRRHPTRTSTRHFRQPRPPTSPPYTTSAPDDGYPYTAPRVNSDMATT